MKKETAPHSLNGVWNIQAMVNKTLLSLLVAPRRVRFYPFPNKKPDGSNVENFIEEGNVVINVADWIFYMSYEGGVSESR